MGGHQRPNALFYACLLFAFSPCSSPCSLSFPLSPPLPIYIRARLELFPCPHSISLSKTQPACELMSSTPTGPEFLPHLVPSWKPRTFRRTAPRARARCAGKPETARRPNGGRGRLVAAAHVHARFRGRAEFRAVGEGRRAGADRGDGRRRLGRRFQQQRALGPGASGVSSTLERVRRRKTGSSAKCASPYHRARPPRPNGVPRRGPDLSGAVH